MLLEWLPVLIWLVPWYLMSRIASQKPALSSFPLRSGRPLSVIIPARNEAEVIERCVRSILASTYSPLEVLVVDDRSTDATAEIVERIGREDGRLKLVRGEPLPGGWYGKPWACVQGLSASAGEILCFTDADTVHEPELLARSVGAMEVMGATLFTVMPKQICLTWSERLILPQFFYLLAARFHPGVLNRATRTWDAIANGQYIVMTRAAYQEVGTHEAVKEEVAEDLALAREVVRRGGKVRMVYAFDLMATRMYTGWAHLREGFSKNAFMGARLVLEDHPLLQRVVPYFVGTIFLVWLTPPVALALQAFGVPFWSHAPALTATLVSLLFWTLFSIGIPVPFYYGFLYPLGALGAFDIVMRSAIRGGRRIEWKGRVYGTSVKE